MKSVNEERGMTQDLAKSLFEYSNGELRWGIKYGYKKPGDVIGEYADPLGYKRVAYKGRKYLVHRIVFAMHHGYFPECVDHIDFNPSNNAIENLRASSKASNCQHRPPRTRNRSGYKGVSSLYEGRRWRAHICVDMERIALGNFLTAEDAARAYDRAARKYHGEFAFQNFPN